MSLRRLHHEQPQSFAFTSENEAWAADQIKKYPPGRQASAVIPILWRGQEQEGWVTSEWRQSENNRRAKFYSLTRAGRKQLQLETVNWDRLARAITAVVRLQEV